MVYIDVRKLSIRSLKECRDWANCVDLNENLRPPGNIPEAEERWYEEEDFNAVINVIINQGIFQKAGNEPMRMSGFARRVQRRVTSMCIP